MKKEEWLEEEIFVDEHGRDYNLSDVPMTYMTRQEAFDKRGYGQKMIKQLWKEDFEDKEAVKKGMYNEKN